MIKTAGDLRQFLASAILAVKNGDMRPEEASRITKLAAQINESFYSEIKVAKTLREAGSVVSDFGETPIGSWKEKTTR